MDWGGRGIAVVFLPSLGHTAYVFDVFAPPLADTYHVLGIPWRGFGASLQPDTGYDVENLGEDTGLSWTVFESMRRSRDSHERTTERLH
jgi:pimeloyl-ACP methyl ester carboxylesterase